MIGAKPPKPQAAQPTQISHELEAADTLSNLGSSIFPSSRNIFWLKYHISFMEVDWHICKDLPHPFVHT